MVSSIFARQGSLLLLTSVSGSSAPGGSLWKTLNISAMKSPTRNMVGILSCYNFRCFSPYAGYANIRKYKTASLLVRSGERVLILGLPSIAYPFSLFSWLIQSRLKQLIACSIQANLALCTVDESGLGLHGKQPRLARIVCREDSAEQHQLHRLQ